MRRPWIADKSTAVAVGLVLVTVGYVILYDAFEGRGDKKPLVLGAYLPW